MLDKRLNRTPMSVPESSRPTPTLSACFAFRRQYGIFWPERVGDSRGLEARNDPCKDENTAESWLNPDSPIYMKVLVQVQTLNLLKP